MVEAAFSKISDWTNLIFHSDQEWLYQHRGNQKMLQDKGGSLKHVPVKAIVWTTA